MLSKLSIYFDGACHNKKDELSPMGIGVAVYMEDTYFSEFSVSEYFPLGTSNVAEWNACVTTMCIIKELSEDCVIDEDTIVEIYSDSQLITNQFNGLWKMNDKMFKDRYRAAWMLLRASNVGEEYKKIIWIPREQNQQADKLSKIGLKKQPK